jgi:hypothetical protein
MAQVEARCDRELATCRFVNSPLGACEIFYCTPQFAREVAQWHVVMPGALPWRLRLPALRPLGRAAATLFALVFRGAAAIALIGGH